MQKRSIESREKLLKAAYELFSEKGYYYTNTKEIVKRAGISIGNFYNYFKDKGDIYNELAREYIEGSEKAIAGLLEQLKGLDKEEGRAFLTEFMHRQLQRATASGNFFDDSTIIAKESTDLIDIIREGEARVTNVFEEFLKGQFTKKPEISYAVMARMLYVTTNEVMNDMINIEDEEYRREYIQTLVDFIMNYAYE